MKIAIRAGHNFSVPGVFGFIDETCENRRIKDEVIKYLDALDYEVLDVTSGDCYNTIESDLAYGVNSVQMNGMQIFLFQYILIIRLNFIMEKLVVKYGFMMFLKRRKVL